MNPSMLQLSTFLPMIMETKNYPDKGTVIFNEGDKVNGFYFIRDGDFDCIDSDGVVVTKLGYGDIFGELGKFLSESKETSLTIQSASPNASLYFVDIKYYNIISTLKGVRSDLREVNDYIVAKNRPEKAPVSFHSTLATSATGIYLCALATCISPGLSASGIPQLFDFSRFGIGLPATQIAMLLFAVVGVTGSFRLPANTPLLRRHFFNCEYIFTFMIFPPIV